MQNPRAYQRIPCAGPLNQGGAWRGVLRIDPLFAFSKGTGSSPIHPRLGRQTANSGRNVRARPRRDARTRATGRTNGDPFAAPTSGAHRTECANVSNTLTHFAPRVDLVSGNAVEPVLFVRGSNQHARSGNLTRCIRLVHSLACGGFPIHSAKMAAPSWGSPR